VEEEVISYLINLRERQDTGTRKKEVLENLWRTCFGRGDGPVVRQTEE
jgi:hypothetical protein